MSLSDGGVQATMPVAPTGMMNSGFCGFGGDGAWWIIILFLFVFCGWGNNGWGNNGNGGVIDGYVLTSDFANVERKIDSVNQGLCDGFYQQAQLVKQLNAMQMQAANCCCENRAAIAQVRYDMATQACDTRNTVQNATRDIIDNANANSRAILDFLTQSKLSDLQAENQGLKLAASQAAQNSYLVSQLRPSPIPAYTVQNPYCCNQFAGCGC